MGPGTGSQLLSSWLSSRPDYRLKKGWFSLCDIEDLLFLSDTTWLHFGKLYNMIMGGKKMGYIIAVIFFSTQYWIYLFRHKIFARVLVEHWDGNQWNVEHACARIYFTLTKGIADLKCILLVEWWQMPLESVWIFLFKS